MISAVKKRHPLIIPKTSRIPMAFVTDPKANVVSTAPAFPTAAEIPWAVERTRVGNTSTGIRKVIEAGPQLRKNYGGPGKKSPDYRASDPEGTLKHRIKIAHTR